MYDYLFKLSTDTMFWPWRLLFWRYAKSFEEFLILIEKQKPESIQVLHVYEGSPPMDLYRMFYRIWVELSFAKGIFGHVVFVHNKTKEPLARCHSEPSSSEVETLVKKAALNFCNEIKNRFPEIEIRV